MVAPGEIRMYVFWNLNLPHKIPQTRVDIIQLLDLEVDVSSQNKNLLKMAEVLPDMANGPGNFQWCTITRVTTVIMGVHLHIKNIYANLEMEITCSRQFRAYIWRPG